MPIYRGSAMRSTASEIPKSFDRQTIFDPDKMSSSSNPIVEILRTLTFQFMSATQTKSTSWQSVFTDGCQRLVLRAEQQVLFTPDSSAPLAIQSRNRFIAPGLAGFSR